MHVRVRVDDVATSCCHIEGYLMPVRQLLRMLHHDENAKDFRLEGWFTWLLCLLYA